MEATLADSEKIHARLSQMRSRISSKKITADILFFEEKKKRGPNKTSLESILDSLKKHQEDEGSLDNTTIH
jgi:hypothetical protein